MHRPVTAAMPADAAAQTTSHLRQLIRAHHSAVLLGYSSLHWTPLRRDPRKAPRLGWTVRAARRPIFSRKLGEKVLETLVSRLSCLEACRAPRPIFSEKLGEALHTGLRIAAMHRRPPCALTPFLNGLLNHSICLQRTIHCACLHALSHWYRDEVRQLLDRGLSSEWN